MKSILTISLGLLTPFLLTATRSSAAPSANTIYDFKVESIDGQPVNLADYKGKTVMIVNTASQCGYTPQYEGLQALYGKYKAKNFVILGFPSNDFGGQEPGTNTEIKHFCKSRYSVEFPMFSKGVVKGPQKQALFSYLVQNAPAGHQEEIKWNFEKFLIAPSGKVVGRFDSNVTPQDPSLKAAIEKNLAH